MCDTADVALDGWFIVDRVLDSSGLGLVTFSLKCKWFGHFMKQK